jgi:hypothetical protein
MAVGYSVGLALVIMYPTMEARKDQHKRLCGTPYCFRNNRSLQKSLSKQKIINPWKISNPVPKDLPVVAFCEL